MSSFESEPSKFNNQSFDKPKPKTPIPGNILHVTNIHPQLNYEQIKQGLYNLFSIHGPIYDITIKTKENGSHFAFVDFPKLQDAEKALKASKREGKILQNQELIVNYCEDPQKNEARKGAKCFLCNGSGHKAKNCPVKPELIKPPKKNQRSTRRQEQKANDSLSFSGFSGILQKHNEDFEIEQFSSSESCAFSESSQEKQAPLKKHKNRDQDYLRFLKLKKKLIDDKLRKKIQKKKSIRF